MATSSPRSKKGSAEKRLAGQAVIAGAEYAGTKMLGSKNASNKPKKSH